MAALIELSIEDDELQIKVLCGESSSEEKETALEMIDAFAKRHGFSGDDIALTSVNGEEV